MELYSIVDADDYDTPEDPMVSQITFYVRFLYDNNYIVLNMHTIVGTADYSSSQNATDVIFCGITIISMGNSSAHTGEKYMLLLATCISALIYCSFNLVLYLHDNTLIVNSTCSHRGKPLLILTVTMNSMKRSIQVLHR